MNDDVRNSVAKGISMLALYAKNVIDEQGLEKALAYYNKVGYAFGSGTAMSIKQEFGERPPTPEGLKDILVNNYNGFGMDFEIKATSDSVDITINKCPFHQGFSMAGFDNETIAKFCRSGGSGEIQAMKNAYPKIEPFSTPRSNAEGVCKEGFRFKT